MHDESDSEFARYFSYLNLFAAVMLVLVLGANFPLMFAAGRRRSVLVSPHRLRFKKKSATTPARRRRRHRIGDYAFISHAGAFAKFGTSPPGDRAAVATPPPRDVWGLSITTLLLFIGATGSQRRFALHLAADAMEGRQTSPHSSTPRRW